MQFLTLFLLLGLGHIALSGGRLLVSLNALSLGASPTSVGLMISLFAVFPMLFGISMGRWIDHVGVRPPMLWGSLSMALGSAIAFLWPSLATLYVSAVLLGTGHVLIQVAGQSVVGTLSSDQNRAGNFGHLATAYSLASFTGPMSAGFFIEGFGHRYTFLAYLLISTVCVAMAIGRLVHLPEHQPRVRPAGSGSAFNLLTNPLLRPIYIVGIVQAGAWDIYVFLVPIRGTELGFAPSTIGIILGAFSVGTLIVRLLMPWMRRWLHEWQVLAGALAFGGLCFLAVPFIAVPFWFVMLSFALGCALGAGQPNILSLLHVSAPTGRGGEAFGLRVTFTNGGQVILPMAFGAASSALGVLPLFIAFATILGCGSRVAVKQSRRQHDDQRPH